jgi:hypothetical protein
MVTPETDLQEALYNISDWVEGVSIEILHTFVIKISYGGDYREVCVVKNSRKIIGGPGWSFPEDPEKIVFYSRQELEDTIKEVVSLIDKEIARDQKFQQYLIDVSQV